MSSSPAYAATANNGAAVTSATADTSTTAPSNAVTVFTAGASGSRVERVRIVQILTTTVSGRINLFLKTGSSYFYVDGITYGAATVSSTAGVAPQDLYTPDLILKSGYSLVATNTVQSGSGPTAATHIVHAFGGDF